jgi:LPXTG-motif cell wall-anchored protein
MPDTGPGTDAATIAIAGVLVVIILLVLLFWSKGRKMAGPHVFRASRFSRGNLFFPTQVAVTPTAIVHFTPELFGGREQSIHLAHVASVLIDRNLFFSDVMIESSGGASPVRCHGHRKHDAVEMKRLIEQFQSDYYRDRMAGKDRPTA